MAYRYTNTDKWSDKWFLGLKPLEKLLYGYLSDNCDIAGFIEINIKIWAAMIGTNQRGIEGALKGLERGLIYSEDNGCIYLKNFLKHQKNVPLNPQNKAHIGILKCFDNYKYKFKKEIIDKIIEGALKGLASPLGNGIGNGIGNNKGGMGENNDPPPDSLLLNNDIIKLYTWIGGGKLPGNHERVFPERFLPKTDKQKKNWLECLDKLHRIDHCTLQEINGAIIFAREDPFWKDNFLSLMKLRDKDKDGVKYIDRFIAGYEKKYKGRKPKN